MTTSGSEAFSIGGERLCPEEDSKVFSVCGEGDAAAEEGSQAFARDGEGVFPEEYVGDIESRATSPAANSKRIRQFLNEGLFEGIELDVGVWTTLDDNLVEKVIARLPFKFLFQASSLSRTWRDRFCSPAFQREVQDTSPSSWKSYAPVFVNKKNELVGYEGSSKQLHRLPTHSYLREDVGHYWSLRSAAGSLLCWICPASFTSAERILTKLGAGYHVHVTNPLTKGWKQLPPRPEMDSPKIVHVGWEAGSKGYKVIVGTLETVIHRRVCIRLQIYDSIDDSWTVQYYNEVTSVNNAHGKQMVGGSAFIRGVLHMLIYTFEWRTGTGYKLISFDAKRTMWKETHLYPLNTHHQPMKFYEVYFSEVLVCGPNVMLIIHMEMVSRDDFDLENNSDDEEDIREVLSVFKLDLERGLAFELATAPDEMLSAIVEGVDICSAAGQDGCIYIGGAYPHCSSIVYNMGTREWHWVNSAADSPLSFSSTPMDKWPLSFSTPMDKWLWRSVTYQPGLNPFFEV